MDLLQFYSQISSVSFLAYTLLWWDRGVLAVGGVWSQNWRVLGSVNGCIIALFAMQTPIRQKRPNLRISYFRPSKCRSLHSVARGACPLRSPFPPSLVVEQASSCCSCSVISWIFHHHPALLHRHTHWSWTNVNFSRSIFHSRLSFSQSSPP